MELWRSAENPWGQEVLIGVSWDLMWAAVVAAVVFLVGHAIWIKTRPEEAHDTGGTALASLPEKIERHSLASRIFHWTMALSMLALLITAFVPVMGLQFAWIEIHWMAGVLLIATILYHIIHAIGWQDFWSMSPAPKDLGEGIAQLKHILSSKAPSPPKAGKYPFDHRMYHHAVVVVSLAAMITGALMMVRIDTPFWTRNPYLLSDGVWGWGGIYVLHGFSGVALIVLVAAHIYFAVRPEKWWLLNSMVRGWIDREHYAEHFDPTKWDVSGGKLTSGDPSGGALADAAVSAPREDA